MAFVFCIEIIIDASLFEPTEIDETRTEEFCALMSNSHASSAYSKLLILTSYGGIPRVTQAFGKSRFANIRHRPTMNATGENISPCSTPRESSNGSEISHVPLGFLI